MIMNSREQDYRAKQEGDPNDSDKFSTKASSTSRQWAGFRNPRIVRVSRSFGGKDRHSKVCTVRGLRDRRIRLSVPTAIQLYDLQDRLGLSQPSKVVDWLLEATKSEIDKLPPLQMPPGNFSQFLQPLAVSQQSSASQSSMPHFFNANSSYMRDGGAQAFLSSKEGIKINDHIHGNDQTMLDRSRYSERQTAVGKDKWIESNEHENQEGFEGYAAQLTAQNFFPIGNQSSFPNLMNTALPFNPYYHLEASNLSLSQFGNHPFQNQAAEDSHMALPSGSQLFFCPSAPTVPTIIPPLPPYMTTAMESDPRQLNHFQFLSSSSQHVLPNPLMPTLHLISSPMKSLALSVNPKILHPQENNENKGGSGS